MRFRQTFKQTAAKQPYKQTLKITKCCAQMTLRMIDNKEQSSSMSVLCSSDPKTQ